MDTRITRSTTKTVTAGTGVNPFQNKLEQERDPLHGMAKVELFDASKGIQTGVSGTLPGGIQAEAHLGADAGVDATAGGKVGPSGLTAGAMIHADGMIEAEASAVRDFGVVDVMAQAQGEVGAEAQGVAKA